MACPIGFGELNIPSSRAFWDDCDEDDPLQDPAEKLSFIYETSQSDIAQKSSQCKRMLLVEGASVADFAESTLLKNTTKLADIPNSKSSLHYESEKKMLIVIIEENLTNSSEICELLLNLCEPEEVVTLTIKPKVDFKSESIADYRDEITFLRSIDGKLNNVEVLEAPNFIAGVAAGVCSWRSSLNKNVQSYVAYTDNIALDSIAAKPIIKLLHELGMECSDTYISKKRDDSHLYM